MCCALRKASVTAKPLRRPFECTTMCCKFFHVLQSTRTPIHKGLLCTFGSATPYYKVLPCITPCYKVQLCTTKYHNVLESIRLRTFTKYHSVLQTATPYSILQSKIPLSIPRSATRYSILQRTTTYYIVLLRTTMYYKVPFRTTKSTTTYYKILLHVTVVPSFKKYYKQLQRTTP